MFFYTILVIVIEKTKIGFWMWGLGMVKIAVWITSFDDGWVLNNEGSTSMYVCMWSTAADLWLMETKALGFVINKVTRVAEKR